ncbi:MAG: hypothetical protein M1269_01430 [Chloroflexi bacterium]|nr:hypothetical protein [Chloroflexota bacterium]
MFKDASWMTMLILAIPFVLILLMTFSMKNARKRQDEGISIMEKEHEQQEDNNKLLREILKTLKHIDKQLTK